MMAKIDYERLFYKALDFILNNNGGSLSQALDDIGVSDEEEQLIRIETGWDEE